MSIKKALVEIIAVILVSLSFVLILSSIAPLNMDEFSQYNALSYFVCPLNSYNTFREGFQYYDLAPINHVFLPLMSYGYVGSFPGLIYYPLYKIWPSPMSARFLGLMYLALQAFFLYKIFKMDFFVSFMLLLVFMPYSFQHFNDFGPIAITTTTVYFAYYLTKQWISMLDKGYKRSMVYAFFAGFVIFLGAWTKLSFFFALPSLFILLAYTFIQERKIFAEINHRKILFFHLSLVSFFVGFGAFVGLLLNAVQRGGNKYIQTITDPGRLNLLDSKVFFDKLSCLGKYFTNPLMSADRLFDISGQVSLVGVLLIATILLVLIYGVVKCKSRVFIALNFFLFLLSFSLILRSANTWGMHHVVMCMPFLVLALFAVFSELRKDKVVISLMVIFVLLNGSLYWQLNDHKYWHEKGLNYKGEAHLPQINSLINEKFAKDHVVVVIDWGMYYIKALYGPKDQCVMFIQPLNSISQINSLKDAMKKLNRKVLFLGKMPSESDLNLIKQNFPKLVEYNTGFDTGYWRIWVEL